MRFVCGDTVRIGDAIDARDCDRSATAILAAIRTAEPPPADRLRVECGAPTPVHDHVGHIEPGMGLSLRAALAVAARSLGKRAPQDDQVERLRAELAEAPAPTVEFAADRRAVATAGADEARLRERVASLRGRLQATEAAGADPTTVADIRATLVEVAGELARVETGRIAATQRLAAADRDARDARNARDRRLRLQDRLDNRRREARAHLAECIRPRFRQALDVVPDVAAGPADDCTKRVADSPGDGTDQHDRSTLWSDAEERDAASAALAVARLADLQAPVVLTAPRFPDATAAAHWLDSPVILR